MRIQLQDSIVELDRTLLEKAITIKNMIEDLDIDIETEEEMIPMTNYTKETYDLLVSFCKGVEYNDIEFEKLGNVLLMAHFLQAEDIYERCCSRIYKRIRFKSAEELLDLFKVKENVKKDMLKDPDFTGDINPYK